MQKVLQRDIDKMKFHQSFDLRVAPNVVPLSSLICPPVLEDVNAPMALLETMNTSVSSDGPNASHTLHGSTSAAGNDQHHSNNSNMSSNNNNNNNMKAEQNELRIIIIDENWSQYCYRIKVNTPFGKLINRFCQQVKKIDNKSVLFWYQGRNVEDDDTPRTLQVKDGEVIFAHYIKT